MPAPHPIVRHLIVCDDIVVDQRNPLKVSTVGLISTIRSTGESPFPLRLAEFCVYTELTECRGSGELYLKVVQADTEQVVFESDQRVVRFAGSPLDITALAFRIRNCRFSRAGLNWVQLWHARNLLAQQPLLLS